MSMKQLLHMCREILEMFHKVKIENLEESLTTMQLKATEKRRKSVSYLTVCLTPGNIESAINYPKTGVGKVLV